MDTLAPHPPALLPWPCLAYRRADDGNDGNDSNPESPGASDGNDGNDSSAESFAARDGNDSNDSNAEYFATHDSNDGNDSSAESFAARDSNDGNDSNAESFAARDSNDGNDSNAESFAARDSNDGHDSNAQSPRRLARPPARTLPLRRAFFSFSPLFSLPSGSPRLGFCYKIYSGMANILLVDDDPVLLALLGKLLTRQGHAVTAAEGGPAGLAAARERAAHRQTFDLVLTDLRMPNLDGYDLTRALRAEPATAAALILLVSSHLEGPDPALARAAGADAWAAKPLHAERLAALTQRLLARQPAAAPAEGL